jgi:hypothetical protein
MLPLPQLAIACFVGKITSPGGGEFQLGLATGLTAISVGLLLASIVFGVIALSGLRKYGWRGILIRSVVGTTYSAIILGSWIRFFLLP